MEHMEKQIAKTVKPSINKKDSVCQPSQMAFLKVLALVILVGQLFLSMFSFSVLEETNIAFLVSQFLVLFPLLFLILLSFFTPKYSAFLVVAIQSSIVATTFGLVFILNKVNSPTNFDGLLFITLVNFVLFPLIKSPSVYQSYTWCLSFVHLSYQATSSHFINQICVYSLYLSFAIANRWMESCRQRTEQELESLQELFSQTLNNLRVATFTLNSDLKIIEKNERFCNMNFTNEIDFVKKLSDELERLANSNNFAKFISLNASYQSMMPEGLNIVTQYLDFISKKSSYVLLGEIKLGVTLKVFVKKEGTNFTFLMQENIIKKEKQNNFIEPQKEAVTVTNSIAHDVKNALICIENLCSEMIPQLEPSDGMTNLKKSLDNSINLCHYSQILLQDLKDVDRVKGNKLTKNPEAVVNLKELCDFVLMIFQSKETMLRKGIDYILDFKPADVFYLIDEIRLKQILINVVSNSWKFTKKGFIKITVSKIGEFTRFSIQDTGCGMSEQEIINLNEAFVKNTTDDNKMGWGIGMNIVRQLLLLFNCSRYKVYSELQKGTKVEFDLPLKSSKQRSLSDYNFRNLLAINKINNLSKLSDSEEKPRRFESKKNVVNVGESLGKNEQRKSFERQNNMKQSTVLFNKGFYFDKSLRADEINLIGSLCESESQVSIDLDTALEGVKDSFTNKHWNHPKVDFIIMVVDDNLQSLKSAKRVLALHFKDKAVEIVGASDGTDCLYKCHLLDYKVDIILCDQNMECIDGSDVKYMIEKFNEKTKSNIRFCYYSCDHFDGQLTAAKPLTRNECAFLEKLLK